MSTKRIQSALISVFHKDGLDQIIPKLVENNIKIYSTGGTFKYIEGLGAKPIQVESITGYPSILDGRVKTLHPAVFGGILARRAPDHLSQLEKYEIPEIDLVVVDLYPFEATVKETTDEGKIIEKIDIGGISLIRAAAKNYHDIVIIPSKDSYSALEGILDNEASTDINTRKKLAAEAFSISSHYDTAIFQHFIQEDEEFAFRKSVNNSQVLRYGENPHQTATYFGGLDNIFEKLNGKALSFNNLVDIDAAVQLMAEFKDGKTIYEAWQAALAGDNVSAFGGILIANATIDLETAQSINELFYEVLIAPDFEADAVEFLSKKKKRVLLKIKEFTRQTKAYKSILNGVLQQDTDIRQESAEDLNCVTDQTPNEDQVSDLLFANKLVKHIKSNTIVLVKDHQLLGMGSGQTSRVDACNQAIQKALKFGFDLQGSVMASDAFFPFPDCVELAYNAGIKAVIQPGGSINDQLSIDFCNSHGVSMVTTGVRHFKH